MRNISKTNKDPLDGLTAAGKNMHEFLKDGNGNPIKNPCHQAYHSELSNLQTKFSEYTTHTIPCTLEQLSTSYPSAHQYHEPLYNLYDSQRTFLKNLRKELFEQGNRIILCPYCHSTPVQDLDHYIPRSLLPEFSVHYYNLIPLCHQCNKDKDNAWLDNSGKRIYFNAYFDPAPNISDIVEFTIAIHPQSNAPQVSLAMHPILRTDSDPVRLAKTTVDSLKLIKRYWQTTADHALNAVCKQIIHQYIACLSKPSFEAHYETQMRALQLDIYDSSPSEIISNEVKRVILGSGDFKRWAKQAIESL